MENTRPQRKHPRLDSFDYSSAGAYFITICTQNRRCLLSRPTLMDIVCAFESLTTRKCKAAKPIDKLFQPSFYEHIVRGREDYEEIYKYIADNPQCWSADKLYTEQQRTLAEGHCGKTF